MTVEWWLTYLLTTTLLSLFPGSGAINTMSTAISHGYRGAAISVVGLQIGLATHILLVGIGLGTLFSGSLLAFEVLKWAGAAYLIFLGVRQWHAAGAVNMMLLSKMLPSRRLLQRAILVNLTNPKSIVFLAALFPQFIVAGQPQAVQYLILGITTILVDMGVMAGYTLLAARIATWITGPHQMKLLNRVFGGLFILVGVALAFAQRMK